MIESTCTSSDMLDCNNKECKHPALNPVGLGLQGRSMYRQKDLNTDKFSIQQL